MSFFRSYKVAIAALSLCLSTAAIFPSGGFAQNGAPNISMVTLQTMPGQSGQQMVVTPKGQVVPLPGAGVNSNVVQIYIGSQGGTWYVDKNGQQVDLTEAMQQFRKMQGGVSQSTYTQQAPPQYAPQPVNVYNNTSGSGGGDGTAAAGALGMMAGVATGAALSSTSYYHGVPYGYPMGYGAGAKPYYVNRGGNTVNVNQSATANVSQNTSYNNIHANNFQKQQDWYNQQIANKGDNYKKWQNNNGDNPFMHPDGQNGWRQAQGNGNFANANGQGQGQGGRKGRFGRGQNGGGLEAGGDGGAGLGQGDGQGQRRGFRNRGGDGGAGGFQGADGGGLGGRLGGGGGGRRRR